METEKSSLAAQQAGPSRKPRSDGQRNRELIVQVAKIAFTENGIGTSLDDIAKKAGVGAGTLYRHFPSREALIEAVYRAEVERLMEAAERLGRELPPVDALRAYLLLFVDHLATKKVIAPALQSLVGGSQVFEENMSKLRAPIKAIYDRAIEAGDIRPDINPVDHLRAIVGVTFFGDSEDWKESATRLVDILILGSRPL
jgi:AcrR family transcriptional regulator